MSSFLQLGMLRHFFFFGSIRIKHVSPYRLGDAREVIRGICGDAIANQTKPIWGLDAQGEASGVWRDTGVPNMWYAFGKSGFISGIVLLSCLLKLERPGNFAVCRFNSRHLALRECAALQSLVYISFKSPPEIKAIEEGVFGERYALQK